MGFLHFTSWLTAAMRRQPKRCSVWHLTDGRFWL